MFKKLNTSLTMTPYEIGRLVVHHGDNPDYGIFLSEVQTNSDYFYNFIPEEYRKGFNLRLMRLIGSISPHTDSDIITSINFYIEAKEAITFFYDIITENPNTRQLENQTNGRIFDFKSVKPVKAFKAKDNEIYVLDVTKPHSVTSPSGTRLVFSLQTNVYSFAEVLEMLSVTGNV